MNAKKWTVILVLILGLTISLVCGDNENSGWKGYGIYNLNASDIAIENEIDSIEINMDKLTLNGEYVIRNNSQKDLVATIGTPTTNITKFNIIDKGNQKKWKVKSLQSIQYGLADNTTLPQEANWYTVDIPLKAGESRVINSVLQANMIRDSSGYYNFTYLSDREEKNILKSKSIDLKISIKDFKPYDIKSLEGPSASELSNSGQIHKQFNSNNLFPIVISYQKLDTMMLEKLRASHYKIVWSILTCYYDKDYEGAITLCNSYINRPQDKTIETEQIKFIMAECYRSISEYDNYFKTIQNIDFSKLYPDSIKFKIYSDQLNIYKNINNIDKQNEMMKAMTDAAKNNRDFLIEWLINNGYDTLTAENTKPADITPPQKPEVQKEKTSMVKNIADKILSFKYISCVLFAMGLLLGYIIGRRSGRRKRSRSMYLYRN